MRKGLLVTLLAFIVPITIGTISAGVTERQASINNEVPFIDSTPSTEAQNYLASNIDLYLIEKAAPYLKSPEQSKAFEKKVRKISEKLDVPPEWLMGLMHSESGFNPSLANLKGSGAKGLIQWTKPTLKSLGVQKLPKSPLHQLDYVEQYLTRMKKSRGEFSNFTDLKLSVLYPIAVGKQKDYTLYESPFLAYHQNSGLDVNKDGKVTVEDIERKMQKDYPTVYIYNRN